MNRKFSPAGFLSAFLVFALYAAASAAETKITIGYAAVSPRTLPLIIAQEQGLFAKHGIETRLVLIKGAPILVASLISGDIEVGYTGGPSVIGAAAQGTYLKILASVSSKLTHTVIANPSIKTAENLKGKKFGIQSIGGSTWMHTMLALEHMGIDPKRDNVSLLVVGDSVVIGQALEAGRVDAAVLDGALMRRLKNKGFSVIVDLQPFNIPMLNQAIVVSSDYLQKHADTVEKILMTLVESLAFSLAPANKPIVIKTMMRRFQINDPTVGEEGYQDYLTSVERKPIPSLDALRNIRRLMAVQNPKVANVKVEDLVESRLIRKLDESGFIDRAGATYGLK
ncbi:MAG TPA: ABC transporter substrate-binding protein [Candidatus Acidoferrales bacterium]|nr:ABC transporter substrate-binding protein [Candidatus Acidoferrales bacterium]